MHDPGLDQYGTSQLWRPGDAQGQLECRIASAFGMQIARCRADRRQCLHRCGGEAVDKRRECEIAVDIEIEGFYAVRTVAVNPSVVLGSGRCSTAGPGHGKSRSLTA